jgi:hypothetical protein
MVSNAIDRAPATFDLGCSLPLGDGERTDAYAAWTSPAWLAGWPSVFSSTWLDGFETRPGTKTERERERGGGEKYEPLIVFLYRESGL